ncbi:ribosomal protein L4 domain-containing protein [Xylariales sp. PMI_506]|nr:ribosomal protein L4 domain-containing protein [Xylariales sp. PMI_506]
MAGKGVSRGLSEAMKALSLSSQTCREAASHRLSPLAFTRTMATETSLPKTPLSTDGNTPWRPNSTVPLTIFGFPSYEPQRLEAWSSKHLNLPLRRDILHLAVVYEGDNTRQGTASSKTRWEVRGSGRKLFRQKGLGRARVGDAQSPLRKGGGKVFGPKPRDFGTKLNRKVYDLAWRTALSYRYRRGELIVCEDGMELPLPVEFDQLLMNDQIKDRELIDSFRAKWARQVMDRNEWGKQNGRSTFITGDYRENLFEALEQVPNYGRALEIDDVDVKNLLETGRLVVERWALEEMIKLHQSDLVTSVFVSGAVPKTESGGIIVE